MQDWEVIDEPDEPLPAVPAAASPAPLGGYVPTWWWRQPPSAPPAEPAEPPASEPAEPAPRPAAEAEAADETDGEGEEDEGDEAPASPSSALSPVGVGFGALIVLLLSYLAASGALRPVPSRTPSPPRPPPLPSHTR